MAQADQSSWRSRGSNRRTTWILLLGLAGVIASQPASAFGFSKDRLDAWISAKDAELAELRKTDVAKGMDWLGKAASLSSFAYRCASEMVEHDRHLCSETAVAEGVSKATGLVEESVHKGILAAIKGIGKLAKRVGAKTISRAALKVAPKVLGPLGATMAAAEMGWAIGTELHSRFVEPAIKDRLAQRAKEQDAAMQRQLSLLRTDRDVAMEYRNLLTSYGFERANHYLDGVLDSRAGVAESNATTEITVERSPTQTPRAPEETARGPNDQTEEDPFREEARDARRERMLALVRPGMRQRRDFLKGAERGSLGPIPSPNGVFVPVLTDEPSPVLTDGSARTGPGVQPVAIEDPDGCVSPSCANILQDSTATLQCIGSLDQSGWSMSYTYAVTGGLLQDIMADTAELCARTAPEGHCRQTLQADVTNLSQSRDTNISSTRKLLGDTWRLADGPSGQGGWSDFWNRSGCSKPPWYSAGNAP